MDTSKIATAAQEFMAGLEADEEYADSEIVEVGIVAHLRIPDGDEANGTRDGSPTYCTNDSRIYQTGLFQWAKGSAEWSGEPQEEPPGPDD